MPATLDPNDANPTVPFFPPSTRTSVSPLSTSHRLSLSLLLLLTTALCLFLLSVYRVQHHLHAYTRRVQHWHDHPIIAAFHPPLNTTPTAASVSIPPPLDDAKEDALYYAGHVMTPPADVDREAAAIVQSLSASLLPSPFSPSFTPTSNLSLSHVVARLSHYSLVYDYGGVGCSGWALEANTLVYGLSLLLPHSSLHIVRSPWECSGLPPYIRSVLHALSAKPLPPHPDVLITHRPPPQYPHAFPYSTWGRSLPYRPCYVIGRSMTEVHRIPTAWADAINERVDEVWLPSTQQLAPFLLGGALPSRLFVVPEPVDVRLWDDTAGRGVGGETPRVEVGGLRRFNFLSVFKLEERKGWKQLLYAFFQEFTADEDVALHLLTYAHATGGDPRNPHRIQRTLLSYIHSLNLSRPSASLPFASTHVISHELPTALMPAFYRQFDAFVLPTHGEGWGLPVVEAMMAGLAVVVTNSSGMLDFVDESVGWMVRVWGWERAQGPEWKEEDGGLWASVSVRELRKVMRRVVEEQEEREVRAKRAMQRVRQRYAVEVVAERMVRRLYEVTGLIDQRRQQSQ